MRVQDLGCLKGPLLLFGGPYSNLPATQAILGVAAARNIDPRQMICTGDVVAYGGKPHETADLIQAAGMPVVMGNCEEQLAQGATDCGCGFAPGSTCSVLSGEWYALADARVTVAQRRWMGALPRVVLFEHAGRRFAVIHGGAAQINRFIWPTSAEEVFEEEVATLVDLCGPIDGVIAGHCGLAFQRPVAGVDWINVGAIGLPPNDGTPETAFAILEADGALVFVRLAYDHAAARAEMIAAGLVQGYETAVVNGWWPSEEVLPPPLRRAARPGGGGSSPPD